jgi:Tfp pilus assembly PilM family ATPase
VQSAGFIIEDVEPEPCIVPRAIAAGNNEWPELVVSIGKHSSAAMVIANGVCEFSQSIAFGGEQLTEAIHAASDRTLADAEQFKRRHSLISPMEDPFPGERAAMNEWAHRLAEELYNVLTFQQERDPARRIVLLGGGARLDGLVGYINSTLGVPVEYAEPAEHLTGTDASRFLELANAYALALHPGKSKTKRAKKSEKPAKSNGKKAE